MASVFADRDESTSVPLPKARLGAEHLERERNAAREHLVGCPTVSLDIC
jgi:hypothetical protein